MQVIQQAIEVLLPGKRIVDQKYFGAGIVLHIAPAIDSDRCDVRMIYQILRGIPIASHSLDLRSGGQCTVKRFLI